MFRKRKSERGGKPRRARTAFTYEQLVTIVDEMDLTGGSYDVIVIVIVIVDEMDL